MCTEKTLWYDAKCLFFLLHGMAWHGSVHLLALPGRIVDLLDRVRERLQEFGCVFDFAVGFNTNPTKASAKLSSTRVLRGLGRLVLARGSERLLCGVGQWGCRFQVYPLPLCSSHRFPRVLPSL